MIITEGVINTLAQASIEGPEKKLQKIWDDILPKLDDETIGFIISSGLFLDTVDREMVLNVLAKNVTGMDWPCFGDTEEYSVKFYELLRVGLADKYDLKVKE